MLPYDLEARRVYEGVEVARRSGNAASSFDTVPDKAEGQLSVVLPEGAECLRPLEPGKTMEIPGLGWTITAQILKKMEEFHEIPKKKYTKWFDYDKIKDDLVLRKRCPGDYFILDDQGRRQTLKKYFINEKVPSKERANVPVLADGAHIIWAIGYRISEDCKVTDKTERILEVRVNGGNVYE